VGCFRCAMMISLLVREYLEGEKEGISSNRMRMNIHNFDNHALVFKVELRNHKGRVEKMCHAKGLKS
jgi:hypothetical protein